MKKLAPAFICLLLAASAAQSQKTIKNQYQLIAEAAFPVKSDYRTGWNTQLKWLTRLGPTADLTVNIGYSSFSDPDKLGDGERGKLHLVPFLVGYRHHIVEGLFVEPQAGYGELGGRVYVAGDYRKPSIGAFMWALNLGYKIQRFDVGLRYFGAHGAEDIDAGTWYNLQYKYVGLFVAFNLRKGRRE